ncbi:hypothetical protein ACFVP0_23510 [Streptomyces cinereoruber]|uniref:hypothetical protein n=1 Tax=Streptomyces cinereoruber TaxID=67260 RepID=UPI003680F34C
MGLFSAVRDAFSTAPIENHPDYDPQQGVLIPESERRIRETGHIRRREARLHYEATGDPARMFEEKSALNAALREEYASRNRRRR